MNVTAQVFKPFYDLHGRKYIDLIVDGEVTRVKVPFRYNRVMCHVSGIIPVQELKEGMTLDVYMEKVIWEGDIHWVLRGIRNVESN